MPSLGADMDEGTVLEWLVAPGQEVRRGDLVAVVKTDKADVEIEVFESGVVGELLVPEGTKVPVGTPLATIRAPGEAPAPAPPPPLAEPPPAEPAPAPAPPAGPAPPAEPAIAAPGPAAEPARPAVVRVTPRARRRAQELGVDVDALAARIGGVVTGDDVEAAARGLPEPAALAPPTGPARPAPPEPPVSAPARPPASPAGDAGDRVAGMRRAIAAAMARSNRDIPHYHLLHHTPLTHALAWLERANAARSIAERILPAALFYRATALAARQVPGLNGWWVDGAFQPGDGVHLGVAIAVRGGGLVAPAIHDADRLPLRELMAALADLTARARGGRLRGSELTDATITVTNLGDRGVEVVHGLIYPPQVALVGFGKVVERPWAEDGVLASRPVVAISLAGDHRASDGHLGARFLATVDRLLREVESL